MAFYGYTIGDVDVNPSLAGEQLQVYRFLIPTVPQVIVNPELVGTVTVAASLASNSDLEGLGTNYTTGRISAVNEPASFNTPNPDGTVRISNVDRPFAPVSVTPTRTPSTLNRFGTETGADFGRNFSVATNPPAVLYNLGANADPSDGPVGSSLYRISLPTTGTGTLTLVDSTPTTAETAGTTPTNPGRYADGLAIDNITPGRYRAFASDFSNVDGDGAQLHKVDLLTGQLSAPIQIRNAATNQLLAANSDSGLAFTRVRTADPGVQRLVALLENGFLYEITGFQDELSASGLSLGSTTGTNGAGFATATLIGVVNLPNALSGATDYEGFTITNEGING